MLPVLEVGNGFSHVLREAIFGLSVFYQPFYLQQGPIDLLYGVLSASIHSFPHVAEPGGTALDCSPTPSLRLLPWFRRRLPGLVRPPGHSG